MILSSLLFGFYVLVQDVSLTSEQIHYLKYLVLKGIAEASEVSAHESQKIYETILLALDQEIREENNLN